MPTLPATATGSPAVRQTWPSSSATVVLPFVPVTAQKRFGSSRQESSSSPITGMPRSRAAAIAGASAGTPGLLTTQRARSSSSTPTTIQEDFDAQPPQPFRARGRSGVDADHPLAALGEQPRRRLARAGEADDQVRARRAAADAALRGPHRLVSRPRTPLPSPHGRGRGLEAEARERGHGALRPRDRRRGGHRRRGAAVLDLDRLVDPELARRSARRGQHRRDPDRRHPRDLRRDPGHRRRDPGPRARARSSARRPATRGTAACATSPTGPGPAS